MKVLGLNQDILVIKAPVNYLLSYYLTLLFIQLLLIFNALFDTLKLHFSSKKVNHRESFE